MKTALALLLLAGVAPIAPAGIGVETYGTAAPPAWMDDGRYFMFPAPFRGDLFADVTETTAGYYLDLIHFSFPVSVRAIGSGWATWSHGYTGNVFYTNGWTEITMTLSSGIQAFRFYAEPNPFDVFQMTATGSDGSTAASSTQGVEGSFGAAGWGFYITGVGIFDEIHSVQISSDVDFAVGEFATNLLTPPAPATLGLFALGGLVVGRRR